MPRRHWAENWMLRAVGMLQAEMRHQSPYEHSKPIRALSHVSGVVIVKLEASTTTPYRFI